jgi:hypothetical protein
MPTTKASSGDRSSSVIERKFDADGFWSQIEAKDHCKQSRYQLYNSGFSGSWLVGRAEESKDAKHAAYHNMAMKSFSEELGNRIPLTSDDASRHDLKSYHAQLRDLQTLVGPLAEEQSGGSQSPTITIEGEEVDPELLCGAGIPCSNIWISVTSKGSKVPHRSFRDAFHGRVQGDKGVR